jgi:biotin carboxyl carrier protein
MAGFLSKSFVTYFIIQPGRLRQGRKRSRPAFVLDIRGAFQYQAPFFSHVALGVWPGKQKTGEQGMKQIVAPMPGKVVDILVKTGEEVLEYQEVLILEAMKMENAIPSPEAGKVKEIKVKKDDTVAAQQVLMLLE